MNVFDLSAKITLDSKEYEKGLNDASSKFSKFGDGLKSAAGKVGDVLAGVGKAAAVGIGAASTAFTALAKQSLDIYANFEQLEGGTKLMFGSAADYIIQRSEEAYKTVQLSQNEYLQQVNGFAVGLKTALEGNEQAAAELADKIIQAEADIVAATGNTQEMVQNAFNGIMRNNYMMLDNLGLGIKPTKEGMEEVIQKVNEWNAAHGEATEYVIDNLADVQAALVDYVEMQGMAGYASMEAGSTITGSIAGVKAAWKNFLSGNGSPKDFVDMLIPTARNLSEKMNTLVPRLTEGLTELAEQLSPYIPEAVETLLPMFVNGGIGIINGLAKSAPELITAIQSAVPEIINTAMSKKDEFKQSVKDAFAAILPDSFDNVPELITSATGFVTSFLADVTSVDNLKKVNAKSFEFITKLLDGLTSPETLKQLADPEKGVFKIVDNIGQGLVDFSDHLFDGIGGMLDNFVEYLSDPENVEIISKGATDVVTHFGEALTSENSKYALGHLLVSFCQFVGSSIAAGGGGDNAVDWENDVGSEIARKIAKGMWNNFTQFLKLPQSIADGIADAMLSGILGEDYNLFSDVDLETQEAWQRSGTKLQIGDWIAQQQRLQNEATNYGEAYKDLNDPNIPEFVKEQMRKGIGHASGFYVNQRAYLSGLVGEAGDEVLLPLDSNTAWIDKLADKLGASMNGAIYITINAPTGNADDIVAALDEALRNRQIMQDRSVGGTGWK